MAPTMDDLLAEDIRERGQYSMTSLTTFDILAVGEDIDQAEPCPYVSVVCDQGSSPRRGTVEDMAAFHHHYLETLPDSIKDHVVVAGGAVHNILFPQTSVNDIDYFLVGIEDEDHARRVVQTLSNWLVDHHGMDRAVRTPSTLTLFTEAPRAERDNGQSPEDGIAVDGITSLPSQAVHHPISGSSTREGLTWPAYESIMDSDNRRRVPRDNGTTLLRDRSSYLQTLERDTPLEYAPSRPFWQAKKVQCILRLYTNLAELLGGFDIQCAAVAMTAHQDFTISQRPDHLPIYGTKLAHYGWTTGRLVVDTTRRSPTFEARIYKYLHRGIQIVLPHLNPDIVASRFNTTSFKKRGVYEYMGFDDDQDEIATLEASRAWHRDASYSRRFHQQVPLPLRFHNMRVTLISRLGDRTYSATMRVGKKANLLDTTLAEDSHAVTEGYDDPRHARNLLEMVAERNQQLAERAWSSRTTLRPAFYFVVDPRDVNESVCYRSQILNHDGLDGKFPEDYILDFVRPTNMAWSSSFRPLITAPVDWYPSEFFIDTVSQQMRARIPHWVGINEAQPDNELFYSIQRAAFLLELPRERVYEVSLHDRAYDSGYSDTWMLLQAVVVNGLRRLPLDHENMDYVAGLFPNCMPLSRDQIANAIVKVIRCRYPFVLDEDRLPLLPIITEATRLVSMLSTSANHGVNGQD